MNKIILSSRFLSPDACPPTLSVWTDMRSSGKSRNSVMPIPSHFGLSNMFMLRLGSGGQASHYLPLNHWLSSCLPTHHSPACLWQCLKVLSRYCVSVLVTVFSLTRCYTPSTLGLTLPAPNFCPIHTYHFIIWISAHSPCCFQHQVIRSWFYRNTESFWDR